MSNIEIELIIAILLLTLITTQCIWLNNRYISQKQENLELFKRYTRIFYESTKQNDRHVLITTHLIDKITEESGLATPVYFNGEKMLLYDEVSFQHNGNEKKGWIELLYSDKGIDPKEPFVIASPSESGYVLYNLNEASPLKLIHHFSEPSDKKNPI